MRSTFIFCGASLLSPGALLTSAHCVARNRADISVRCGEWDTRSENEPINHQELKVASINIHPEYDPQNHYANDFAVIFVDGEFSLDFNVDTVCLPRPGDIRPLDKSSCFLTGWGEDPSGRQPNIMRSLKQLTVNKTNCQSQFRKRLGEDFELPSSSMCAGGIPGRDACGGSGGAPLMCLNSPLDPLGGYFQAGIVSWGASKCEGKYPTVYSAVSEAVCWIDMIVSCKTNGGNSLALASGFGYSGETCRSKLDPKYRQCTVQ